MAQVAAVPNDQLSLFDLGVDMTTLREERARLMTWKRSKGTQKGYDTDWRIFSQWCERAGRDALPTSSDTVCQFVAHELKEGKRTATISRRLASIAFMHDREKLPPPVTRECRQLLTCSRRERREVPKGKKALDPQELMRISLRLGKTNVGVRDRALLVFGLASGLRRSELIRLDFANITVSSKGVVIDLPWSKTDQEGKGRVFGIFAGDKVSTDPVRTMRAWLDVRGKEHGPLFTRVKSNDVVTLKRMSGMHVARIVHRSVRRIGLDPKDYGAHSLRAGLCTAAAANGASDQEIMLASGHKNSRVMQKYVRSARVFAQRNPLAGVL